MYSVFLQGHSLDKVHEGPSLDKKTFKADRRWFEKHPNRSYHLRPAAASEIPLAGSAPAPIYTVIRQPEPGIRLRLFIWIIGPVQDDEETAAYLWHRAAGWTYPPDFLRAINERECGGQQ
jgi:hypothetical protein